MSRDEKRSEYEELEKKITYSSKNIWLEIDDKTKKDIFNFSDEYKQFLDYSRTERLTVKWTLEHVKKIGFEDLNTRKSVKTGDFLYVVNREKNIALIKVGKEPLEEGINFIIAHGDAPRLDLKQIPVIEDVEIALLKTHYYGGIKKYHWLNIPLAIAGVVVTSDGSKIDLTIGLKEDEPIFVIPDLLPHLAKKVQGEKKAFEFIEGESLNLVFGNIPVKDDKVKEKVKLAVLQKLNKEYKIVEEDLISAELEVVPALRSRDVGIDGSMIGGYGHDDRVSSFAAIRAILDADVSGKTCVVFITDKEEIGSDGPTGMKSQFVYNVIGRLFEKFTGRYSELDHRTIMENSVCISADVNAGINPMYKSVHDEKNTAKISHGVVITKFTGSGGKYMANDADAELVGRLRKLFNENGIFWQYGGMGKVDEGGGGTIAKYFALYNASVIDCGVPVIGMHSPYEIISKADLYYSYKGYRVFLEKGC